MLIENKSNGLTLQNSSEVLLKNVDKLNFSSSKAASSLEETSAALDDVTSNIRKNTNNILKVSDLSKNIVSCANIGEDLALKTSKSMQNIAKEIKTIVNSATLKANEGTNISNDMIDGYKQLHLSINEATDISNDMIDGYKQLHLSINEAISLISDIQVSSQEQLNAVEQINSSISLLDKQTQENANIAAQSHEVAVTTDFISNLIVKNANEKEFEGKNDIKAKVL